MGEIFYKMEDAIGRVENNQIFSYFNILFNFLVKAGYLGCFKDLVNNKRDLPTRVYSGEDNTIDSCRQMCDSNGFEYLPLSLSPSLFPSPLPLTSFLPTLSFPLSLPSPLPTLGVFFFFLSI
jgi:hypothetical protein